MVYFPIGFQVFSHFGLPEIVNSPGALRAPDVWGGSRALPNNSKSQNIIQNQLVTILEYDGLFGQLFRIRILFLSGRNAMDSLGLNGILQGGVICLRPLTGQAGMIIAAEHAGSLREQRLACRNVVGKDPYPIA